jgi:hypothetical protein
MGFKLVMVARSITTMRALEEKKEKHNQTQIILNFVKF